MKPKLLIVLILACIACNMGCKKETLLPSKVTSPTSGNSFTPNLAQRAATDVNLQILALGLTDLAVDEDFLNLLYLTMPCDGFLDLNEFEGMFRLSTEGRELFEEMNVAICKYLQDENETDYVTSALNGLVIDDIEYAAEITIPYFDELDLEIPAIVAAGVDDSLDRLTGYIIDDRDVAYIFDPILSGLNTISAFDIDDHFAAPTISGHTSFKANLFAQPVSAQEARLRPLIVIALGDEPDPEREIDPCYFASGGGWSGGGSGGGSGASGCTINGDEDCAYKVGPVDYPACGNNCSPAFTATGYCLTNVALKEGILNATHNSSAGKVKVRYMITRMFLASTIAGDHLGDGGNTTNSETRIKLEDRDASNISSFVSYTDHVLLPESLICQVNNNGFDLNAGGAVVSNSTYWWYNRYWITIFEDDWWVTNRKEIHPPGLIYYDLTKSHKIRATAKTDLFYNGIIVLDNYSCAFGNCDSDWLDDGYPGAFKFEVSIY